jgi:N4-gp56 family major capsid protein
LTDPTPSGLSAVNVTATVAQFGNYEQITDLLSLTAIDNQIASAIDLLAKEAALTIDSVILNTLSANGQVLYASALTYRSAIAATNVITVADVRKAKRTLDNLNARPHTGPYYVAVANPYVIYDLQGDSNWVNAHIYVDKGVEKVYNGEAGMIFGVKFIQTTQTTVLTNSGSANTEVYLTKFMGSEWFGVSDLQNLKTYVKSPSPASALELYSTVGWKATFACKELNASYCVSYESAATQ